MKKIIYPIIALIITLTSCQKVIDIDLNSATPQYVIEAVLVEGTQNFEVHVTQTSNYFSTDKATSIKNATVTLQKEGGTTVTLANENNGYYTVANYTATNKTNYQLKVVLDGKTFEATSYLAQVVPLDSIKVEKALGRPFGNSNDSLYQLYCTFQDPASETNFYQIKTIVNGKPNDKGKQILVLDDRLSNGNKISIPIFTTEFKLHDTVQVELLMIDQKVYDYFYTLSNVVGNGNNSAAPTNPISNWSGGALGYFGAFGSSKKEVIVK
jgi:hypothetical protein